MSMWKYIRLLRLQHQYLTFGSVIAGAIYANVHDGRVWIWAIAATLLSAATFAINELSDSDTDKYSWNSIHKRDTIHTGWAWGMIFFVTAVGLLLSWFVGAGFLGIALWTIGALYSLEPVRMKRRFGLDILAQLGAYWIIPFFVPVLWASERFSPALFIAVLSAMTWAAVFPYELADFSADRKAKLKGTHTVIGMRGSLQLGLFLAIGGMLAYGFFRLYEGQVWSVPYVFFPFLVSVLYVGWLRMNDRKKQEASLQTYVRMAIPLSRLVAPYLLFVWLV